LANILDHESRPILPVFLLCKYTFESSAKLLHLKAMVRFKGPRCSGRHVLCIHKRNDVATVAIFKCAQKEIESINIYRHEHKDTNKYTRVRVSLRVCACIYGYVIVLRL